MLAVAKNLDDPVRKPVKRGGVKPIERVHTDQSIGDAVREWPWHKRPIASFNFGISPIESQAIPRTEKRSRT